MKLLNFGILAALAVSAMALAQPDRGQGNKAPRRMKLGKAHGGRSQNGRRGQGSPRGRSKEVKRFRKGSRKRFSARRANFRSIPAKARKQQRRRRNGGNQAKNQGYYYDRVYYYYDQYEYATTAETTDEDCFKVNPNVRVGFSDDVASVTKALSQLSASDVEAIQQEAMMKTNGQFGRFKMEDGGSTSYEVKNDSLFVREVCPGQGSVKGGEEVTTIGVYTPMVTTAAPDYTTAETETEVIAANEVYTNSPVNPPNGQEQGTSIEDCFKVDPTVRVGYWDNVASVTKAVPQLSANDAKDIQQEAMTKFKGETGRFLMEDGGTCSYESKSHSLIVMEICPGQGTKSRGRSGGQWKRKRPNRKNRQRNRN